MQNPVGFGIIATRFDHCNLGEHEMKVLLKALPSLLLIFALPVYAGGDAARGEEKSGICAACHGADGNSVMAMWPKLAGQHEAYLERQLSLIKGGQRNIPEMAGIITMVSEEDIADISAYYAAQTTSPAVADPEQITLGERIYRAGNAATDTPACMACHGPAGNGNPLAGYPALAGQHDSYLAKMLNSFKAGTTWGDDDSSSQVMVEVSSRMTDAEIAAVSSYIQGLYRTDTE
jgi:cytochrome c553